MLVTIAACSLVSSDPGINTSFLPTKNAPQGAIRQSYVADIKTRRIVNANILSNQIAMTY
jgi:hypothetical protein